MSNFLMNDEELEEHRKASWTFFRDKLGSPRHILAPMVDQSELPWRMLSRKYDCHLTYTPMLHANMFSKSHTYRKKYLDTSPEDKPLIVQFCANNPDIFLQACLLAQDHCDAIDLNLGCPQSIAKRGHYGAFLQDEWDLITKLICEVRKHVKVPLTAKIRVFPDVKRTVAYAETLERAGVSMLAVHGRIREQKGIHTGLADWKQIKAVKESIKIPVVANGNIQYLCDVERCIEETGVDGVMSAEGHLHNPAIFSGIQPSAFDMSLEYLDLVDRYPCCLSFCRAHLYKMLQHCLLQHLDYRELINEAKSFNDLRNAVIQLMNVCGPGKCKFGDDTKGLAFPHWICQPYERPKPPSDGVSSNLDDSRIESGECRPPQLKDEETVLRLREERKRRRIEKRTLKAIAAYHGGSPPVYAICVNCPNPRSKQCDFTLCKSCCLRRSRKDCEKCSIHNPRSAAKLRQSETSTENSSDVNHAPVR